MAYPRFCRPMGLQTARNFRSVAPPFEVSYFTTLCDTLADWVGIDPPMTAAAPIRFARRRLDRAQTRRNGLLSAIEFAAFWADGDGVTPDS